MSLIMLLVINYPFPVSVDSSPDTLQNSLLRAVITPVTAGVRAGSLIEIYDFESGIDLANGRQFGGIQCGPYIPMNGNIVCYGDTMAVFTCPGLIDYSTSDELPIGITLVWRLVDRSLEIGVTLEASGNAELWEPLEIDFFTSLYNTALFWNQSTSKDRTIGIHAMQEIYRISGDQVVRLTGDESMPQMTWVFPNPSKGILILNTTTDPACDTYLTLRFFDVEPPRENCMGQFFIPSFRGETAAVISFAFRSRRISFQSTSQLIRTVMSGPPPGLWTKYRSSTLIRATCGDSPRHLQTASVFPPR